MVADSPSMRLPLNAGRLQAVLRRPQPCPKLIASANRWQGLKGGASPRVGGGQWQCSQASGFGGGEAEQAEAGFGEIVD